MESSQIESRYSDIHGIINQVAVSAIQPYLYQGEAFLCLSLFTPEEDRDMIIDEIGEFGGSSEFLTLDDEKIIFRLV